MLRLLKKFLSESPLTKAVISFFSVTASSILCSSLVVEISDGSKIDFSKAFKTKSFPLLIICFVLVIVYQWLIFSIDREIMKFADSAYCKAYIRKNSIDALAHKYAATVKKGKFDDLSDINNEIERFTK